MTKEVATLIFTGTLSTKLYLDSRVLVAIEIPDDVAFTGITLTLKAGSNENNLKEVRDSLGNLITVTIHKNSFIALDVSEIIGMVYLQFSSSANLNGKSINGVVRDV
jgi:hypothetical protein